MKKIIILLIPSILLVACASTDYGPYREAPQAEPTQRSIMVKVEPIYPDSARSSGIEGWVLVGFTIGADGKTKDIEVVDQYPGNVFGRRAAQAVGFRRYIPSNSDTPASEVFIFELDGNRTYSREGN